jgi:RNA polymerase sigma factor (sigma-70 family)
MAESQPRHELESLLVHRTWVRRMARALVDEATADDLEQEAWLRSLGRPAPRHPRAWLGTVLRRLAANLRRGDRRRTRREAAPRPTPAPADPADLVARAEASERVVRATLSLDEPYRSVVLLRYFEDLGPARIAERQGVPVETVRTRLRRARTILRERLDGEAGGRATWMSAGLPLCDTSRPGPGVGIGLLVRGAIMSLKAKLVIGGMLAAFAVVFLLLHGGEDPGSTGSETVERRSTAARDGESASADGGTDADRRAPPGESATSPADAETGDGGGGTSSAGEEHPRGERAGTARTEPGAPAGLFVSGVVRDADGEPVTTEVRLRLARADGGASRVRGRTDPEGRFTVGPLEPGTYDLEATPWPPVGTDLLPGALEGVPAGAENLVVRLRRGLAFHGVAVDREGRPVEGGLLSVTRLMPEGFEQGWRSPIEQDGAFRSFPLDPDATYDLRLQGPTGAQVAVLKGVRPGKVPNDNYSCALTTTTRVRPPGPGAGSVEG